MEQTYDFMLSTNLEGNYCNLDDISSNCERTGVSSTSFLLRLFEFSPSTRRNLNYIVSTKDGYRLQQVLHNLKAPD